MSGRSSLVWLLRDEERHRGRGGRKVRVRVQRFSARSARESTSKES